MPPPPPPADLPKSWQSRSARHTAGMGRGKKKMRKLDGGVVGKSKPPSLGIRIDLPEEGEDSIVRSDSQLRNLGVDRPRSLYLVARHCYSPPGYSLYKVDSAALSLSGDGCSSDRDSPRPQRLRRVARLDTDMGGKAFAAVRGSSRHGAWIAVVGGFSSRDTLIFDTCTHQVIRGPNLQANKWCPVVASVGDRIYALSSNPRTRNEDDFVPWFEVLDLSQAGVTAMLPLAAHPTEFSMPMMPIVAAHALVGNYILISLDTLRGTFAFDTNSAKWHVVSKKDLPFSGQAVPLGLGHVFLGLVDNAINAYLINVIPAAASSDKDHAPKLSISMLSVIYNQDGVDPGGLCIFSLGNRAFCSLSCLAKRRTMRSDHSFGFGRGVPRKVYVNLTTYQLENSARLGPPDDETLLPKKTEIAISNKWDQAFKIRYSSGGFPSEPIAFALSI